MNRNHKIGLVLLIFCITMWFFVIPWQLAGVQEMIYPRFIIVWIAVCGVLLLGQGWKDTTKTISNEFQDKKGIARVTIIAITYLIYILMIDFFGFFIPSLLFLVITMLNLGIRDWKMLVFMPAILLLPIYLLLVKLLCCPLPKGSIF